MTIVAHGKNFIACSFVDCIGEGAYKGKLYRWEFSEMFGPTFLRKDGEFLKNQPGPKSYAWKAFEEWLNEMHQKRKVHRKLTSSHTDEKP